MFMAGDKFARAARACNRRSADAARSTLLLRQQETGYYPAEPRHTMGPEERHRRRNREWRSAQRHSAL